MQKKKYVRAVDPNKGVEARYRRDLDKLLSEMSKSVQYWIAAEYKTNPPRMEVAMDALPSAEMAKKIAELGKRWIKRFDEMAEKIAERFVSSGSKATDASLQQAFKDAGWTVKFKPTPAMRDAMNATIVENVKLISDISRKQIFEISGTVMRGYTAGRDLKYITDELEKRHAMGRRRAAFIARDQSNKLNATATQARRIELGLYKAVWVHSSAGRHPRPSHVKAGKEKLEYDVRQGAYIDGEYILPGFLPNCRCGSKTILPF